MLANEPIKSDVPRFHYNAKYSLSINLAGKYVPAVDTILIANVRESTKVWFDAMSFRSNVPDNVFFASMEGTSLQAQFLVNEKPVYNAPFNINLRHESIPLNYIKPTPTKIEVRLIGDLNQVPGNLGIPVIELHFGLTLALDSNVEGRKA